MSLDTSQLMLLEDRLHRLVSERLQDRSLLDNDSRGLIADQVQQVLQEEERILPEKWRKDIIRNVINRIIGYGPLEPFLHDPGVTEIMVNASDEIFIERKGKLEPVRAAFRDDDHIRQVIDRIIAPLGRRVDESVPFVDARLPDGSRVNAIIPPLAIQGPALTIRRFSRQPFTLARLEQLGTLSETMAGFLQASVRGRLNILISGGTGSGKTSTLNALIRCIPHRERLVTIEDTAELQLNGGNFVSLEARPPNIEGKGEVTIRTLVRNALRMRPDRIIVGEVRGGEAFDMLQAMNTGHPGSLTTVHANSPEDAVRRVESMVLMAGMRLPQPVVREQIASAVDLILQQERLPDGSRKITSLCEICAAREQHGGNKDLIIRKIFTWSPTAGGRMGGESPGRHRYTGVTPKCVSRLGGQDFRKLCFPEGEAA